MSNNEKEEDEDTGIGAGIITSDKYTCEICHSDFPTRSAYTNHKCIK